MASFRRTWASKMDKGRRRVGWLIEEDMGRRESMRNVIDLELREEMT
jgi:hypothetical protein